MNYEQEEEYLTNDLSRKLMQVMHGDWINVCFTAILILVLSATRWFFSVFGLEIPCPNRERQ